MKDTDKKGEELIKALFDKVSYCLKNNLDLPEGYKAYVNKEANNIKVVYKETGICVNISYQYSLFDPHGPVDEDKIKTCLRSFNINMEKLKEYKKEDKCISQRLKSP